MSARAEDLGFDAPIAVAPAIARLNTKQRAWIAFGAMLLGNFMAILDVQIVASSVNEIRAGLSASADEISWVQTAYLIAEVIAIPLSGFLSRSLSTRIYFGGSAFGFTCASLACALSWNLPSLIVFRVVQGFFAGGLIPTTMSALFLMFPQQQRTLPYVLCGMVSLLAPSIGAATGGTITHVLTWPWLFLINLVPGLIVTALALRFIDIDRPQTALLRRTDFAGLAGLAAFLGSLQYLLEEGPRNAWFEDRTIGFFALMSIAGAAIFGWRVRAAAEPIVDLRALRNANFRVGCCASFVVGVMLYGIVYLIPTFLGLVRGYDSLQVGQVTMLSGITMFLSAPLAGRLQEKIDPRYLLAYGLGMIAFGDWLDAALTSQSGLQSFLVPQLIRGHGFTFCLVPMTVLTLGTLPEALVKSGSGLFNLMRNLGGAFGIAGIQTLLRDANADQLQKLASNLTLARLPVRDAYLQAQQLAGAFGDEAAAISARVLEGIVRREALVLAYNQTFITLAWLMLIPLLALPLASKPTQNLLAQGD
jgi:DHA2 family multidrug resistance protein